MKYRVTIKHNGNEFVTDNFVDALNFIRKDLATVSPVDVIESDNGARADSDIESSGIDGEWVICATCDAVANTRRGYAFIDRIDD